MRRSLPGETTGGLADVSELSLRDLDELDRSALVLALQELLDPTRRGDDSVARFTAYTDHDE